MPTDDDPFERAARREAEIADELARGRLSSEQAEQLRDLLGAEAGTHSSEDRSDPKSRLTLPQLRRMLDEGVEPEVLAAAMRSVPGLSVDELIDVLVDFGPDEDFFVELEDAVPTGVDYRSLVTFLEHGVEPDAFARLRRSGQPLTARQAAQFCEEGVDLCELADLAEQAESIGGAGIELSIEQLARIGSEGIDLDQVAALVQLGLGADEAVELAAGDVDPTVLRRLLEDGVEIDWAQVVGSARRSPWSGAMIGFKGRSRHFGLILGDHVVGSDATVSGAVIGTVTVRPGARVTIDALVTGDVVVQPHASVVIGGTVRGRVRNHGGRVEVSGSVRGGVQEVVETAV